jgi:hypothetical protein
VLSFAAGYWNGSLVAVKVLEQVADDCTAAAPAAAAAAGLLQATGMAAW